NMVSEVKKRTGWKTLDEIKMTGNYRGRECTASNGGRRYSFNIRFDSKGGIELFSERAYGPSWAPWALDPSRRKEGTARDRERGSHSVSRRAGRGKEDYPG